MTEPAATLIDILRALADPTRLRIMRLLTRMELAVGELAQVLDQSQPRVSRHIRILSEAGLAGRCRVRRAGRSRPPAAGPDSQRPRSPRRGLFRAPRRAVGCVALAPQRRCQ